MQVKKFEARTMKEALEMVKTQLGPEAIILSARDNNRSFGLVGEGSVEITAAISAENLQKRKFAESKLREEDRERFVRSSARNQRVLIEQMVQKQVQKTQYRPITTQRYIDIDEPENIPTPTENAAQLRIKDAAQRAWVAMNDEKKTKTQVREVIDRPTIATQAKSAMASVVANFSFKENDEIYNLKNEINDLKTLLNQFQNVPQTFTRGHKGAAYGLGFEVSFLFEKLKTQGVEEKEIVELLEHATSSVPKQKMDNKMLVEGVVARRMMEQTLVSDHQNESKFHFFFGPSGSGKTSALVKLASHKVVTENKRVALITTDTYKVGAADQLRIFAQILNIPFAIVRTHQDWAKLGKYFDQLDHVFIDFPGLSLKRTEEQKNLEALIPQGFNDCAKHLVLSALGKYEDLNDIVLRYKHLGVTDLIFNCIDESVQCGNIFSLNQRHQLPLHSFGMGPRLPEDFEYATKERVLDLIFKITQNNREERRAQQFQGKANE